MVDEYDQGIIAMHREKISFGGPHLSSLKVYNHYEVAPVKKQCSGIHEKVKSLIKKLIKRNSVI